MWETDDQLRTALRSELDQQAPAPTTELAGVLRRGRKRLATTRAVVVCGVAAVLFAVTFGVSMVRSSDYPQSASRLGAEWVPVNVLCTGAPAPRLASSSVRGLSDAFYSALTGVTGIGEVNRSNYSHEAPVPAIDGVPSYVDLLFEVTDAQGTGSVTVTTGEFTGDPAAMADAHTDCGTVRRLVRPDGAVLQLHDRTLWIYTSTGWWFEIVVRDFGRENAEFRSPQMEYVQTGPGRTTPLLDDVGLAQLGLALLDGPPHTRPTP